MKEHNCITCGRLPVCTKVRRLVIADADPKMIEEAEKILGKRRYLIVGKTETAEETLRVCEQLQPDMLLCGDLACGRRGMEIIPAAKAVCSGIRCVLAVCSDALGGRTERMESEPEFEPESGIRAVAWKPYDREKLLKVMDDVKFQPD